MSITERSILAGGCFWGMQDLIRKLSGVISTRVGYSGGDVSNATYRHHGTHAEAIEVVFDPAQLSFRDLLAFFFQIHDPTTVNRQGNDRGTSYRSGIYFSSDEQRTVALDTIADVNASGLWPAPVVTEVRAAGPFWEAEPEHQDYLERLPHGYTCHYPRPSWVLPRRQAGTAVPPPTANAPAVPRWSTVVAVARRGNATPPRRVEKSDAEWRAALTPEQYQVTRRSGTERAFSSEMCSRLEPGRYHCACCDTRLFHSTSKFDSGSGWPSFTQPDRPDVVAYHLDESHGMQRVETTCNVCDAHLGHVFPDGPEPTGLRYCINALSLRKHTDAHV